MNIPLMSLVDLTNFWLKPVGTFANLFGNKKNQRMTFTKIPATFAIENENHFFGPQYPEKALFYVDMDSIPKETDFVFIIDKRNNQFKTIAYGNNFYKKIAKDTVIGMVVDIFIPE
jgi:hypothetical protein